LFGSVRRSSLFRGWHVRAFSLAATIENRGTALIISVVLRRVIGLLLVRRVSRIIHAIRDRDRIPDGTGEV